MKKWLHYGKCAVCLAVTVLLLLLVYGFVTVPDAMTRAQTDTPARSIYTLTPMTVRFAADDRSKTEYDALVKLFASIPVKHTRLTVSERRQVAVGGEIFGLRLYTSGVIVVSVEPVQTADGTAFPARQAGIRAGDIILTVDGEPVNSHAQFSALLADAQGKMLHLTYLRNGKESETTFEAAYSAVYDRYMAGLWVRDSAAGIGTLTFSMPQTGVYAGLGHAVCDVDTGEIMPLYNGDIVSATLHGVKKGTPGQAGELRGAFQGDRIGSLQLNEADGVYGILDTVDPAAALVPVALPQEVEQGEAQIVSTVDESGPRRFSVEIEKVMQNDSEGRNLIVHITDEALLRLTGGIVQGMSGSPVLQHGRLVGAVTHVFINDPTRGYAIFAQTMLQNCAVIEKNEFNQ